MNRAVRCLAVVWLSCCVAFAQPTPSDQQGPTRTVVLKAGSPNANRFVGRWRFRSYLRETDLDVPIEKLSFQHGTFDLWHESHDRIEGVLDGTKGRMALSGNLESGNLEKIVFRGQGLVDGKKTTFDFVGYLSPDESENNSQRTTMVGTLAHASPSSDPRQKPEPFAHWVAMRDAAARNNIVESVASTEAISGETRFGGEVDDMLRKAPGQPMVLVFSRGFSCLHCAEQVNVFSNREKEFRERNTTVTYVISDTKETIARAIGSGASMFRFVADPKGDIARRFGFIPGGTRHGLALLDTSGQMCWSVQGDAPVTELAELLQAIDRLNRDTGGEP